MFIHWGLYAVPAGMWKGEAVHGFGEWLMFRKRIPLAEYGKLAGQFNPADFNADEWVKIARDAGMKYIVITAKHHDGFAMFKSECSDYNIYDATPFKRDPMKELAEACGKYGLKLCFYYSQAQDWAHPGGLNNTWDYDPAEKDFEKYYNEKCAPQIRELLTNYGPIGILWCDTPGVMEKKYAKAIVELVRSLQPDCLINTRVGHEYGDYTSMSDNAIPRFAYKKPWETPATLNDTWGFKTGDRKWKTASELIRLLVDINGKGGNYLLNVGPDAKGVIPAESAGILRQVGEWMKINGDSIYGTVASPEDPYMNNWGNITYKPGKLYLHVYKWPDEARMIYLMHMRAEVTKAYFLAQPDKEIPVFEGMRPSTDGGEPVVTQRYVPGNTTYWTMVRLPEKPITDPDTVICLELDREMEFGELI